MVLAAIGPLIGGNGLRISGLVIAGGVTTLTAICDVLGCTPGDLFWVED